MRTNVSINRESVKSVKDGFKEINNEFGKIKYTALKQQKEFTENKEKLAIVEKKMEFTKAYKHQVADLAALEERLNDRMTELFSPTQQRVLELQERMGSLCNTVLVDFKGQVDSVKLEMEQALGNNPKGAPAPGTIKY